MCIHGNPSSTTARAEWGPFLFPHLDGPAREKVGSWSARCRCIAGAVMMPGGAFVLTHVVLGSGGRWGGGGRWESEGEREKGEREIVSYWK